MCLIYRPATHQQFIMASIGANSIGTSRNSKGMMKVNGKLGLWWDLNSVPPKQGALAELTWKHRWASVCRGQRRRPKRPWRTCLPPTSQNSGTLVNYREQGSYVQANEADYDGKTSQGLVTTFNKEPTTRQRNGNFTLR